MRGVGHLWVEHLGTRRLPLIPLIVLPSFGPLSSGSIANFENMALVIKLSLMFLFPSLKIICDACVKSLVSSLEVVFESVSRTHATCLSVSKKCHSERSKRAPRCNRIWGSLVRYSRQLDDCQHRLRLTNVSLVLLYSRRILAALCAMSQRERTSVRYHAQLPSPLLIVSRIKHPFSQPALKSRVVHEHPEKLRVVLH